MLETGITLVTQRKPDELELIKKECGNYILSDKFILLNSPMGILLVDKIHTDFKTIVGQCIVYVRMFGDKESEEKYKLLIE